MFYLIAHKTCLRSAFYSITDSLRYQLHTRALHPNVGGRLHERKWISCCFAPLSAAATAAFASGLTSAFGPSLPRLGALVLLRLSLVAGTGVCGCGMYGSGTPQ